MKERTCIKCGKSFPLTSEYFHYKHKDIGEFHVVCKACRSKNEMRLYYKMKEERPEAYEHRQDVLRKYQEDHREEIRAMSKGKRDRSIDRYRKREAAYVKGKRANDPIFLWVDHARKGKQKLFDYHNLRLVKARDNMLKCRSLDYQIGVN